MSQLNYLFYIIKCFLSTFQKMLIGFPAHTAIKDYEKLLIKATDLQITAR
jgi:hypothetical protein